MIRNIGFDLFQQDKSTEALFSGGYISLNTHHVEIQICQVLDAQSWVYVGAPSVTLLCHMARGPGTHAPARLHIFTNWLYPKFPSTMN